MVMIHPKLKVTKNKEINSSIEALQIQMECNGKLTSVLGLCGAPQGNADELDDIKKWPMENKDHDIIVAGDVNKDINSLNPFANPYLDNMALHGLETSRQDFAREEISEEKLTQSCIEDHIHVRT